MSQRHARTHARTHLVDILRYAVHLVGSGHFGGSSYNHGQEFISHYKANGGVTGKKNFSCETDEMRREALQSDTETLSQGDCTGRSFLYGTLSVSPALYQLCAHARRRAGARQLMSSLRDALASSEAPPKAPPITGKQTIHAELL